jgi:hypothetical protein
MDTSDLLNSGEVALMFNVSISRASRLIKRGFEKSGVGFKKGRNWFIFRTEVEAIRPRPTAGRPRKGTVKSELQQSDETREQSPAVQNDQSTTGGES